MGKKVCIVGGVAGGAGTATRLRRLDEDATILVFERGDYISYANCGLPYHIGGQIPERAALLLQTPESLWDRFRIEVRTGSEVTGIDRAARTLTVRGPQGIYTEPYDELVLSPGSSPVIPPLPGIDAPGIFPLWTIPDMDRIQEYIRTHRPCRAVVAGGGFIGIEMAESLRERGMEVVLVEMLDQLMNAMDFDMAQILHEHLAQHGVRVDLGHGVSSFAPGPEGIGVFLQDGRHYQTDLVVLAIGVRPNGELARQAGLETNPAGGIVTDPYLGTEDPRIHALGDAIEVEHFVGGHKTMIPLAGPANRQARILAGNLCGRRRPYRGTQGTAIVRAFDLTLAKTGCAEKELRGRGLRRGEDFHSVVVIVPSHAGYYPGASALTLKLTYGRDGTILGAQAAGRDGVDKRIDVLATAIRHGGTVESIQELELAYAPPYSSAKDPVNMAGFVADNCLSGLHTLIAWDQIRDLDPRTTRLLDVRSPEERAQGQIAPSQHIPLEELRDRLGELDRSREIVVYCAVGLRAYIGARILEQNGFRVRNLAGGYTHYRRAVADHHPVSTGGGCPGPAEGPPEDPAPGETI